MKSLLTSLLLTSLAIIPFSCASNSSTKSDSQSMPPTKMSAGVKPCLMQSAGTDVLRLSLPADAVCKPADGFLYITSHYNNVELWLAPDAKTIDQGVTRVPDQIKSEFKDFKSTSASTLTIANSHASKLSGTGVEADDGDPGTADVIVFQVNNRVFIACTHGEDLDPKAQQLLLAIVQTAAAP